MENLSESQPRSGSLRYITASVTLLTALFYYNAESVVRGVASKSCEALPTTSSSQFNLTLYHGDSHCQEIIKLRDELIQGNPLRDTISITRHFGLVAQIYLREFF